MEKDEINFEFEMNIVQWPQDLHEELLKALKAEDVDVIKGSAFTGADVLTLLGKLTEPVLKTLTSVFQSWSNRKNHKKIIIQIEDKRIEMHGFSQSDFAASQSQMLELMKKMKQIDDTDPSA